MHRTPCPAAPVPVSMSIPDFNLLVALDVLLAEASVARAAERLRLSPSAMSRTLARLRQTTGDPLLVRAGRGLVPTPRALALRERVDRLVQEGQAVLRPTDKLDLSSLSREFVLRTREGFVENFGPMLLARVSAEAPGVRLCFVQKPDKSSASLRDARVDLETGVVAESTGPELRSRALFRDHFVGVVRAGHSLTRGKVTTARYASAQHVSVSRRGVARGHIDEALRACGLERSVVAVVGSFSTALALVRDCELVASVPERQTAALRAGMHRFPLPVPSPAITVSLLWHPRLDADPAHRWLRGLVFDTCVSAR
jgi:DNA-binding transcriptional LysR family regulator